MVYHTLEPFYNKESEILILGSLPSVKSREVGFYYAHPQNRFWKVLGAVYHEEELTDIASKKKFLEKHKIALYDVCASCDILGSSDASIKNVKVNNIESILKCTNIKKIFVNGKTAYNLYNKYIKNEINKDAIYLPSTSSANASYLLDDLINAYQVLIK